MEKQLKELDKKVSHGHLFHAFGHQIVNTEMVVIFGAGSCVCSVCQEVQLKEKYKIARGILNPFVHTCNQRSQVLK